jgi:4-amino-4-deoxy-L-arabinose transferase-like glycosyltransferase
MDRLAVILVCLAALAIFVRRLWQWNQRQVRSDEDKAFRWGIWLPLAFCLVLLLIRFSTPKDFYDNEQSRQGIYVLDLFKHHNWLLQWDGGTPATKPPLYNWLAYVPCWMAGRVVDQLIRVPSALAAIGLVVLVYGMGLDMGGRRTASLAAVIMLANFHFSKLAGLARTDMLLAFFITCSLWVFWRRGVLGRDGPGWLWFHLFIALGILTKGPAGILVPALAVLAYTAWVRKWSILREMRPGWGLLLILGLVLLWLVPALLEGGKDLTGTILDETWNRFFGAGERAGRTRPVYYYIPLYLGRFAPWGLLSITIGVKTMRQRRRILAPESRFAWGWLLTTIGFFSLSGGKRADYIFPAYPAASLLVGYWLANPKDILPTLLERRVLLVLAVTFAVAATIFGILALSSHVSEAVSGLFEKADIPLEQVGGSLLVLWSFLFAAVAILAARRLWKGTLHGATVWFAAVVVVALLGNYAFFCPAATTQSNRLVEAFGERLREVIDEKPLLIYNRTHHAVRFYSQRDPAEITDRELGEWFASGKEFYLLVSSEEDREPLAEERLERLSLVLESPRFPDFDPGGYRLYRSPPSQGSRSGRDWEQGGSSKGLEKLRSYLRCRPLAKRGTIESRTDYYDQDTPPAS